MDNGIEDFRDELLKIEIEQLFSHYSDAGLIDIEDLNNLNVCRLENPVVCEIIRKYRVGRKNKNHACAKA